MEQANQEFYTMNVAGFTVEVATEYVQTSRGITRNDNVSAVRVGQTKLAWNSLDVVTRKGILHAILKGGEVLDGK